MGYLNFGKEQLINLEYSLNKEILRSNRAGAYISTTLNGCNTRKYHGLLICPIQNFGGEKHVLLSSLDVTVIQQELNLILGFIVLRVEPTNRKDINIFENIEFDQIPKIIYRIGGVVLTWNDCWLKKKNKFLSGIQWKKRIHRLF